MSQALNVFLGVLGAIGGTLWVGHQLKTAYARWVRRRRFMKAAEPWIPIGSTPDGKSVRKCDNQALAMLRRTFRTSACVPDTCITENAVDVRRLAKSPLLVIGSPRLNAAADDLQSRIELPFEFVSLTPGLPTEHSVVSIFDRRGQIFTCSADPSLGEVEGRQRPRSLAGTEQDYGVLVLGALTDSTADRQRVIWLGGIHGIGTLGAAKWLAENYAVYDWGALGNVCFLIRVRFRVPPGDVYVSGGPLETAENVMPELVEGPLEWRAREAPASETSQVGLLCDLGAVLLPFDRDAFRRNLSQARGPVRFTENQEKTLDDLRLRFEAGSMDVDEFVTCIRECIGAQFAPDEIKRCWSDIFWKNEREIELIRHFSSSGVTVPILISNTDPLRLEHALDKLGLGEVFPRERIVASFQEGVEPKGRGNSMLLKAFQILERTEVGVQSPVFIDDMRENLVMASRGSRTVRPIHYRSFPQLVFELRRCGLYERMCQTGVVRDRRFTIPVPLVQGKVSVKPSPVQTVWSAPR